MALRKTGKKPAAKAVEESAVGSIVPMAKAKLTVSVKRRLSNGDEVFLAPGIEMDCAADALEATQADVTERVHSWVDELLEQYPDSDPIDDEDDELEDEDEDDADDDADEDEDEDEDEDDADDDGEELTEADVKKMKKAELLELAEEYEIELEGKTVKDMREELIAELFEDEDDDADEDEDEDEDDADDGDDDGDEDDDDDGEEEPYTEAELKASSLEELQEIADAWEIEHPKFKKGTKVAAKKARYAKLILAEQDEE